MYQLKSQISPKKREKKQLMKTNRNINKMEKKDKIDLIFEKTNEVRQTYQAWLREKHILGLKKKKGA